MQFQVSFGGRGARPQASYDFADWAALPPSQLPSDAARIVYRPGLKTFVQRLGGTIFAACIAAALFWLSHRLHAETQWRDMTTVCAALGGLVAFLGLVYPTSCLWLRFALDRDARGGLVVQAGRVFPATRTWPAGWFSRVYVVAQPARAGGGRSGYRWCVRLKGTTEVEFWPDFQEHPPTPGQFSPRTSEFLSALQKLTGLSCDAPVIVGSYAAPSSGEGVSSVSLVHTEAGRFTSLDEVPEHLREEFRRLQAEAMSDPSSLVSPGSRVAGHITQTIHFCDASGREHTYHSLEELPPEIRAQVESHVARAKPIAIPPDGFPEGLQMETSGSFSFRDAQGRERTYDSPDEMPPEVRAVYEEMRRDIGEG